MEIDFATIRDILTTIDFIVLVICFVLILEG
jgi:hypothetical protein